MCTKRAWAEANIGRLKQLVGYGLRSRTNPHRATGTSVAIHANSRMPGLDCLASVRSAWVQSGLLLLRPLY